MSEEAEIYGCPGCGAVLGDDAVEVFFVISQEERKAARTTFCPKCAAAGKDPSSPAALEVRRNFLARLEEFNRAKNDPDDGLDDGGTLQ